MKPQIKPLYITNYLPKGATILLVDMSQAELDFAAETFDKQEQRKFDIRMKKRLDTMCKTLEKLKDTHDIKVLSTINNGYCLENIAKHVDDHLNSWVGTYLESDFVRYPDLPNYDSLQRSTLNIDFVKDLSKDNPVYVAGLWKEHCVYAVARLLRYHDIEAFLYTDRSLCLEYDFSDLEDYDTIDLLGVCMRDGITIKTVNYDMLEGK